MNIDLEAIRARNEERRKLRDAATPGPWSIRYGGINEDDEGFGVDSKIEPGIVAECYPPAADLHRRRRLLADSHFIAHARTDQAPEDVDALLAEVTALRAIAVQVCYEKHIEQWYVLNRATNQYLLTDGTWNASCLNGWFTSKDDAEDARSAALADSAEVGR
jgi:hypothetical protein